MSARAHDRLCVALGLLWVIDGLLQLQPYMWGPGFFADLIGMANMGLPRPVELLDLHLTGLLAAHPLPWDLFFSAVQVGLGAGLVIRRFRRPAIVASVVWALGVWVVGEGFGALFMPGTSMLNGAPGPVLLYAVAAVLVWPGAAGRAGRAGTAVVSWAGLWVGTALLEFGGANHDPRVPAAQIGDGAGQSPAPLAAAERAVAHHLAGRGLAFAVAVGVVEAAVGLLVVLPATRRAALLAGSVVAVLYWALGQDLGGLWSGRATDPGAGPLWLLLAAVVWAYSYPSLGWEPSPASHLAAGDRRYPHPDGWASGPWGSGARAAGRPAPGAAGQPGGPGGLDGHHPPGPQRVHLLGGERQEDRDPATAYPPHAGGAGGGPATSVLLAGVQPP